jgi:glycosyltransferase involved in cell wall biosynthesis
MSDLTLTSSLADQNFERTKSLGILNLSVQLTQALAASRSFARCTVLSNHSLDSLLKAQTGANVRYFDSAARGGLARMLWDQLRCYSAAAATGNEWLLLPKGFASFLRNPQVRLAVYVHDAIHEFYDARFPGVTPPFERFYFLRSLAASLRHAQVVFTNSEFTREEVIRFARKQTIPEPRVVVAGIGFDTPKIFTTEKANRIVLLTGSWPHKRTDLAIPWVERWRKSSGFEGEIHCVGSLPKASSIPGEGGWVQRRRLSHNEYEALVQSARAMVYFSEYEGFGMPPVEAALAGACPVFSSLPATREVMRQAGLGFFNDSFESFHRAMNEALNTTPQTIAAWREELLERHNWRDVVARVTTALATAGPSR